MSATPTTQTRPAAVRVHYYVHGRGRGHATRSAAVVQRLRAAGFLVDVFAGADARATFADDPSLSPIESLPPHATWRLLSLVPGRIAAARSRLLTDRAHVVVSDADGPALWAARSLRVPSIAVSHGLVFSHCEPPLGPLIDHEQWRHEGRKASVSAWGSTRQVAVNFVPVIPRCSTTIVARPCLRQALSAPRCVDPSRPIVTYFRDDDGDDMLRHLVAAGHRVLAFGRRDPTIDGVTFAAATPDRFAKAMLSAAAVVSSAGSQLISECVELQIPQLALYEADDVEQSLNVAMLRQAELGFGCARNCNVPAALDEFLHSLAAARPRHAGSAFEAPNVAQAVQSVIEQLVTTPRAAR